MFMLTKTFDCGKLVNLLNRNFENSDLRRIRTLFNLNVPYETAMSLSIRLARGLNGLV